LPVSEIFYSEKSKKMSITAHKKLTEETYVKQSKYSFLFIDNMTGAILLNILMIANVTLSS